MPNNEDNSDPRDENEIIRQIIGSLTSSANVSIPPGDDCASVTLDPAGQELLLTSDPVIAGVHFDDTASPEQIGHKAAGRVLSDLAAMGSHPQWVLLNIAAPASVPSDAIISIVKGAQSLCTSFKACVVGGDVARSETLSVNAFGCGTLPARSAIARSSALPGERIYVTGQLGGSRSGKHLTFTPRVTEGIWLRENSYASSMIDVSDGLASDLRHILNASGVGAEILIDSIPIAESLRTENTAAALQHALCDGEDFELLFTVPSHKSRDLEDAWSQVFTLPLSCLGSITENAGLITAISADGVSSEMTERGFDHFA